MSKKLKMYCSWANECEYGQNCLAVKSADEGASYAPVLRVRLVRLKLHCRCFSFNPKKDEEARQNSYGKKIFDI